jgi:2-polyprenyl-3-methyl-5-hydroxy-6-metoxy-1,4-benzoquinol methylase
VTDRSTPSAEEASAFVERSSFVWHQRWELVPGFETPGMHDLAYLFDAAGLAFDVTGRSVLDIGTSNGGAAFLLERAGAESVVAVDVYPENRFGFGATRDFLGSQVEYIQGTVYDLARLVGGRTFDLVLFWGVLYHLRHPLLALDEVRAVLAPDGVVSLETAVGDDEVGDAGDLAVSRFYPGDELAGDPSNWFSPTVACVLAWCRTSGLDARPTRVWGTGQMKRCMALCQEIPGPLPYTQHSYEVPLRAEPANPARRGTSHESRVIDTNGNAVRYSPPEQPWTEEYVAEHRRFVGEVLDDSALVERFARNEALPLGYGVGLDERVVEFPWLFSQGLRGRLLDGGSALNHEHILDRILPLVDSLHVLTLEPEELAFPERRVSYVYADLRDLPYKDGAFETVVSLSTLEHVGMDNKAYGVNAPRADDPVRELGRAVSELTRVAADRLLVTVPYGRREDHGWLRQFDREDVESLVELAGGRATTSVFRYTAAGWEQSDLEEASEMTYRDFTADPSPVDDLAAAARAVACISFRLD